MEKEITFLGTDGLLHCTVCEEALEVFYPKVEQDGDWKKKIEVSSQATITITLLAKLFLCLLLFPLFLTNLYVLKP